MKRSLEGSVVCVVGLGYVGLPLAEAFAKSLKVIGFDIDGDRIRKLNRNNDDSSLVFTDNPQEISRADFIIICVPTPVTQSKEPDLTYVKGAAKTIGQNMRKGSVVILESTVYPGVTEEIVKPILEKESQLRCGADFKIGYSPERINPGDKEHSVDKITKVVAGMDNEATELIAELYRKVTPHVFKAKDIKTAEAAKVIENIQRDLNIALMNELAIIFQVMGLNTKDVLDAAATKWNFHRYSPGLVGGHCIPVDPYYLAYKVKELGYQPQVILAGRAINDSIPKRVTEMTVRALNNVGKKIKGSKILVMGLTYKENVADIRQTPVEKIIKELREYGAEIFIYDPLVNNNETEFELKLAGNLREVPKVDAIIIAVAHQAFREITIDQLKQKLADSGILIDVRGVFDIKDIANSGIYYYHL